MHVSLIEIVNAEINNVRLFVARNGEQDIRVIRPVVRVRSIILLFSTVGRFGSISQGVSLPAEKPRKKPRQDNGTTPTTPCNEHVSNKRGESFTRERPRRDTK